MFNNLMKKTVTMSVILLTGYCIGKYSEQRTSNQSGYAVNVIQNQPDLSWRLKYFPAGNFSEGGRDGLWVARFKPRYTGTAVYVVFHEQQTNKNYLLLTVQERVINGQKVSVCEPPTGFFNGQYPSVIPHVVSESSEREIENQINLGKQPNYTQIYLHFMNEYALGKLPKEPYIIDQNLLQTAYREIKEEAGLDIPDLQKEKGIIVSQKIIDELETPEVYSIIRQIDITGDKLPTLVPKDNDEVKHNEWIPLQNINMDTKTVKTSSGIFPLKPYDKVYEDMKILLSTLGSSH